MTLRGILSALALAALLAPLAGGFVATPALEITNSAANEAHRMRGFDPPAAAVGDFNGDGRAEIVQQNDNRHVYVLATNAPRVLAEFTTPYPANWTHRPLNDPSVADVDNDGHLDIVVVNSAGVVCVREFNPSRSSGTRFAFEERWCRRPSAFNASAEADGGAVVADVDGDGKREIFMQVESRGLYAFNHDGSVRWQKDEWGGNSGPTIADLEADGKLDAIFFSDGGKVRAYDAASGAEKWIYYANKTIQPASIPVAGTAADITGDGKLEVVFIARQATRVDDYRANHLVLFVLRPDGKILWKRQPSWANPMSYTHPIVHDLDRDGKPEILAADWNTIGHYPGEWERLGDMSVFAYRANGTLLWRTVLNNTWSNDDLGLADADGDGKLDVLAIGRNSAGVDGLWWLDAATGKRRYHVPTGEWGPNRGPTLGDFDRDGRLDWAVPVTHAKQGGAFRLYRESAPCRVAFGGAKNPSPCEPPASGSIAARGYVATFTAARGNARWIEVDVAASEPLASVEARVAFGPWQPLVKRAWGSWAASVDAAAGSDVQFRARSADGSLARSAWFDWPPA